jgi:hypothetical protein
MRLMGWKVGGADNSYCAKFLMCAIAFIFLIIWCNPNKGILVDVETL